MNVLLIEDNESIIKGLEYAFKQNNFNLVYKNNLKSAKEYLIENKPSIIVLDISLPDGNGYIFYKNNIKEKKISTIFLTANDDEDNIVNCLEDGAEDYITKPFSTRELVARINRILSKNKSNNITKVKDITFDLDKMEVYKNNQKINLTSLELRILNLLFENINKVVTRNYIIENIWKWTGNDVNDNTVTVYLKRIREKLDTDIIITLKGIGYRIDGYE